MKRATQTQIARETVKAAASRVRVGIPAEVVSYDRTTQSATVQPLVKGQLRESGSAYDLPEIPRVPVVFPRGGGFAISWPLVAGDVVWLTFSDRSLEQWLAQGTRGAAPGSRRHHLSDAVAFAGISPNRTDSAIPTTSETELVLGQEDGAAEVRIGDGVVKVGGAAAASFVALAALVNAELSAIKAAFDTHTHTGVTTGAGASGPPAVAMPAPGDVSATKVKAL